MEDENNCSDDESDEVIQKKSSNQRKENGAIHGKTLGSKHQYNLMSDPNGYERIIRKRKRKTGE